MFHRSIRNSIQLKMFASFLLVIILSSTLISVGAYLLSVHILKEKISESVLENLSFLGTHLEYDFEQFESIADYLYVNRTLQNALPIERDNELDYFFAIKEVDRVLKEYAYHSTYFHQTSLLMLGMNGASYSFGSDSDYADVHSLKQSQWFAEAERLRGAIYWQGIEASPLRYSSDKPYVISLARMVKSIPDERPLGMLYLNIRRSFITERVNRLELQPEGRLFILDHRGRIVHDSEQQRIGQALPSEYLHATTDPTEALVTRIQGKRYLVASHRLEPFGWELMQIIPYESLVHGTQYILLLTIAFFILAMLVSSMLWHFISSTLFKPLRILKQTMERVHQGELQVRTEIYSNDEVGALGKTFNFMIKQMNELYRNMLDEQAFKKDAEYKALQHQITPHFLYNTLNSIRWMAIIQRADNIRDTIQVLGRLLKNTVNQNDHFISIQEELQNLKDYIYIQNVRYKDKFEVVYEVDPAVEALPCIKFILQPVVENAIDHGIGPYSQTGTIHICVQIDRDRVITFKVTDNGVGMTPEQVHSIWNSKENDRDSGKGYGIQNVHNRIRLTYGDAYGLAIQSVPGEGTTVLIRFLADPPDKGVRHV